MNALKGKVGSLPFPSIRRVSCGSSLYCVCVVILSSIGTLVVSAASLFFKTSLGSAKCILMNLPEQGVRHEGELASASWG